MRFKDGDVVRLKSGGTKMTVRAVDGSDVLCIWSERGKVEQLKFPVHVLELADTQPVAVNVNFVKPKVV